MRTITDLPALRRASAKTEGTSTDDIDLSPPTYNRPVPDFASSEVGDPSSRAPRRRARSAPAVVVIPADLLARLHPALLGWYRRLGRDLPWRQTRDPYAILVAETMLQQTQVDRVRPKWAAFLADFPTLRALAEASRADVIRMWAGLGYNRRAVALHEVAKTVIAAGAETLPSSATALCALPGIGPYTAGAVACFAFGLPEPVCDVNVHRVLGRLLHDDHPEGAAVDAIAWATARAALPDGDDCYDWNQALMDLGATVCTARAPQCGLCPVSGHCATYLAQPTLPQQLGFGGTVGQIAEVRAPYRPTGAKRRPVERFEGSRRWYRGRAIAALRRLTVGATIDLDVLGTQIDAGYDAATRRPWVQGLVDDLARDGLVVVDTAPERTTVRLA